ncbi:sensory neuron membrane protein 2-like isoform X2 [Aethina tumida]|uniref:sensory neuron membrane protein 2-like isoform X2 n=1 Tax=Aethina tumida TaxID=116153 RepID=UPI002147E192|nr:sensory neuron membrane protein 2-like isoform X2 [Aethina tumida]
MARTNEHNKNLSEPKTMNILKYFSIKCLSIMFTLSLLSFITSLIVGLFVIPLLTRNKVAGSVSLEEGTKQWNRFIELPFPTDFKVTVFEVTNHYEVVYSGAKPDVKEIGPFVYKQRRRRSVIYINTDQDTVSYQQYLSFNFSRQDSVLNDDTEVQVLNPILWTTIDQTSDDQQLDLKNNIHRIFQNINDIFVKVKIKDLLFDGIQFARGTDCDHAEGDSKIKCTTLLRQIQINARKLKTVREYNGVHYFSYFGYKLLYNDDIFTVNRGIKNPWLLGSIREWNKNRHTNFWGTLKTVNDEVCSKIRGTDGSIFSPNIESKERLDVLVPDLCRVIHVDQKSFEVYKDVKAFRFEAPNNLFRRATSAEETDCYCVKKTNDAYGEPSCYLNGVIDLQTCVGAPILLSLPHFVSADKSYVDKVTGLNPNPEKHTPFFLIEANTGTVLKGAQRIQLNMVLRPTGHMDTISIARAVLPMLWVEESMELPEMYIEELKDDTYRLASSGNIIMITSIVVTFAITVLFGVLLAVKCCQIYKINRETGSAN